MEISFRRFLEMADYGFNHDRATGRVSSGMPDGCPLTPAKAEEIMEELKRLPPIGSVKARRTWNDVMEWGNDVGAVKVDISPLGSYKIITRRKIHDLKGEERWLCKNVIPLNDQPFAQQSETVIAHHLYETVEKISHDQIERAEDSCPIFERLCSGLAAKTRQRHPQIMLYRGIKRISEYHQKIYFEYRGAGNEAPNQRRVEQFDIDIHFDPKMGLIRCWACEITSSKGQHEWKVTPSEWDEYFSPTQEKGEIIDAIKTLLNTY
jgi:hypothetical protein